MNQNTIIYSILAILVVIILISVVTSGSLFKKHRHPNMSQYYDDEFDYEQRERERIVLPRYGYNPRQRINQLENQIHNQQNKIQRQQHRIQNQQNKIQHLRPHKSHGKHKSHGIHGIHGKHKSHGKHGKHKSHGIHGKHGIHKKTTSNDKHVEGTGNQDATKKAKEHFSLNYAKF